MIILKIVIVNVFYKLLKNSDLMACIPVLSDLSASDAGGRKPFSGEVSADCKEILKKHAESVRRA